MSVLSCLAALEGVRGLFPSTEKDGSEGSSGLECPRVRAGEGAVQVGETASRASGGVVASPKCPGANGGGDEGGCCEDEMDRRACIQGFPTLYSSMGCNSSFSVSDASRVSDATKLPTVLKSVLGAKERVFGQSRAKAAR